MGWSRSWKNHSGGLSWGHSPGLRAGLGTGSPPGFDPLWIYGCLLFPTGGGDICPSSTLMVGMANTISVLVDGKASFTLMSVAGMATFAATLVVERVPLAVTPGTGTATLAATLVGGLVSLFVFSPTPHSSGVVE